VDGREVNFPVRHGSIGPSVVDISKLYGQTGMFTYDPASRPRPPASRPSPTSTATKGVLLYRGYPIEQLAEHGDFLETCYLLLYGELPTAAQKADFDYRVTRHTMVHEQMMRFFQASAATRIPMAIMVGCVGALSAFYHDSTDISDPHQRMVASMRMIAKLPTLASMAYKYSVGQPFVYPKNDLDYTSNFCACASRCRARSTRSTPSCRGRSTASSSSTPTTSRTPPPPPCASPARPARTPSPASRPASPACGGRRMAARTRRRSRCWRRSARRSHPALRRQGQGQERSFRLMGFGHRVYKNYDPRAKIMQKTTHEVLNELGLKDDPLLDVAIELEQMALKDEYFIEKKLYPNIDFYSGITLKAMGFPTSMFTVLFAVARTVGWIAQWKEMIEDPSQKIGGRASSMSASRSGTTGRWRSGGERGPSGPPAFSTRHPRPSRRREPRTPVRRGPAQPRPRQRP
jgi:citrate synthase